MWDDYVLIVSGGGKLLKKQTYTKDPRIAILRVYRICWGNGTEFRNR